MRKLNKSFLIFTIFIMLMIVFGCTTGSGGTSSGDDSSTKKPIWNSISDEEYIQIDKFVYDNIEYTIEKIKSPAFIDAYLESKNSNLIYYIEQYYSVDETLTSWSINYKQDVKKILSEDDLSVEFVNTLYQKIEPHIGALTLDLQLSIEYYDNLFSIEKELPVDMEKEFTSIFVVDVYIPFKIKNVTTNEAIFINIPIKSFLGYVNESSIIFVYDEKSISLEYDSFIKNDNVIK